MDKPVTDAELDQFYGREVTQAEIEEAIARQSKAFDKDDLIDVLYEHGDDLIKLLVKDCHSTVGAFLYVKRKDTIARRASMELYGKTDVIKPSQVKS